MQTIKGDGFIVTIVKSKRRKTTALKIKNKTVSIHIPSHLPIMFAQEFVQKKTQWIQQKLKEHSQQPSIEKQFIEGEKFLFLGEHYFLRLYQHEALPSVIKTATNLEFYGRLNRLSTRTIRSTLIHWYKQQAAQYLNSRTAKLAQELNLMPNSITIKTYKARWGSCGAQGNIQYNWKLMLAPITIIDYVIIHELCHLKHHNHSTHFWQLVKYHCPTFKSEQDWLKNNGYHLEI